MIPLGLGGVVHLDWRPRNVQQIQTLKPLKPTSSLKIQVTIQNGYVSKLGSLKYKIICVELISPPKKNKKNPQIKRKTLPMIGTCYCQIKKGALWVSPFLGAFSSSFWIIFSRFTGRLFKNSTSKPTNIFFQFSSLGVVPSGLLR